MAKKPKKEKDNANEKTSLGGKIKIVIITLFIIFVWLAIFALLIKLDVNGIGSNVLSPVLRNVPVINKILPEASDEETSLNTNSKYDTLAKALRRIEELDRQIVELQAELDGTGLSDDTSTGDNSNNKTEKELKQANETIKDLKQQVENLKVFEEEQLNFDKLKDEFYNEIVYNDKAPTTDEYVKWYEQISPESAAEIYQQIEEKYKADEETQKLADTYEAMKPAQAAAILQNMTGELDAVVNILNSLSASQRASILSSMDSAFAAKLTSKMTP